MIPAASQLVSPLRPPEPRPATEANHDGVNTGPGSLDDGWTPPPLVTLQDGSHVQLYKDGQALYAAYEAIRHAHKRVGMEVYIFHSDPTGRAFAQLLAAKARSGVPVFLIYDSFGCLDTDPSLFAMMSRSGVRLAEFHPVRPWDCRYSWRPFNRDHRKLLVIDDHIAGLGGLNIGDEYAGPWVSHQTPVLHPWRDDAVGIRGPAAAMFAEAFQRAWRYANVSGRFRAMEYLHNLEDGEVGILATAPTRQSPAVALRPMLREARTSIEMTMSYFAPPDDLIEELCRAAGRGVCARLMLPGLLEHRLLLTAARAFYERLLEAGVEIHERQGCILHAKTTCIDGHTTIIGSTNLDYRSMEYNCEVALILRNAAFAAQMHDLFENDVRFAKRLILRHWRRRPLYDRFVQWAVMRARHLL
jgi:cardiolipin synthase A/B